MKCNRNYSRKIINLPMLLRYWTESARLHINESKTAQEEISICKFSLGPRANIYFRE